MLDVDKTKSQLIGEIHDLRARITELEQHQTEHLAAIESHQQNTALLEAIHTAQTNYTLQHDPQQVFLTLLDAMVSLTCSEYGFLDEVRHAPDGSVFKRNLALSNIAWDEDSRQLYTELTSNNSEFRNLRNLAGAPVLEHKIVIANTPHDDPRASGLPAGHPPLKTYMGIPIFFGGDLIGVAGLANRPQGYTLQESQFLEPLLTTCASVIQAQRNLEKEEQYVADLRTSENKYRLLVENQNDLIVKIDPKGHLLFISPNYCALFGKTEAELIGQQFMPLVHENDRERVAASLQQLFEPPYTCYHEERALTVDGWRCLAWSNRAILDEESQITEIIAVGRDITEHNRVKMMLQALINAVQDSLFLMELDGTILVANEGLAQTFGKPISALENTNSYDLVSPEVAERRRKYVDELLAFGGPITVEDKRDNRYIESRLYPVRDEAGDITRVAIFEHDITSRKRAEQLLEAQLMFSVRAEDWPISRLLQETLNIAEQLTDSCIGFLHFLESDQTTLSLQMWSTNTLEHMCQAEGSSMHYPVSQAGVWADCIPQRKPVIHNDFAVVTNKKGWPKGHPLLHRELVVPVIRDDLIVAILGVGNKPQDYIEDDIEIVSQLANMAWDIVSRKQAEDALRSSQEMLAKAERITNLGSYSWNLKTGELQWSDTFKIILGCETETPNFNLLLSRIHPDDLEQVLTAVVLLSNKQLPYTIEYRIVHPNGALRYVRDAAEIESDDRTGEALRMFGTSLDITDQKLAEQALIESEEMFRQLAENVHEVFWLRDLTTDNMLYVSPAYEIIWGQPRQTLYDNPSSFMTSVYPADLELVQDALAKQQATGHPFNEEYRIIRADGAVRWVHARTFPVKDEAGHTYRLAGIAEDISERKLAETALRQQNEYLVALQNTTLELISQLDLDQLLTNIVTRAGQLIGTTAGFLDLVDSANNQLLPKVGLGALAESLQYQVEPGEGLAGVVWQTKQPILIENYDTWPNRIADFTTNALHTAIGVPLLSGDRVLGVLGLGFEKKPSISLNNSIELLLQFAQLATIAIENARLFARLQQELIERERAETALRESEQKFRLISEQSLLGVSIMQDGRIKYANQAVAEINGYSVAEMIEWQQVDFAKIIHPDDLGFAAEQAQRKQRGQSDIIPYYTYRLITKQGELKWVAQYSKSVMYQGKPANLATIIDITDQKRSEVAEREQRALATALVNTSKAINSTLDFEEVLTRILDAIADVVPHDGANIMLLNDDRQAAHIVRYCACYAKNDLHSPQSGVAWRLTNLPHLQHMIEHNEALAIPDTADVPGWFTTDSTPAIRSYVGAPILVAGQVIGLLNADSKTPYFFTPEHAQRLQAFAYHAGIAIHNAQMFQRLASYNEDLEFAVEQRTNELKVINEQLEAAIEELRNVSRIKDEFVSNVSHELRTPITSLVLRQHILRHHPENLDEHLGVIERETQRLKHTIDDLLRLSRLDQGSTEIELAPVLANKLVEQLVQDRALTAQEKQLSLSFECYPTLPMINADQRLIGQVLGILLTNAINYTPPGGHVTVNTHQQTDNGIHWVGFSVKDDGHGISAEDRARLFERFFRGKVGRQSHAHGTGLGLALAQEIVERHQGYIEVESTGIPGEGACFTVWLPAS